jgi:hypothetical protein
LLGARVSVRGFKYSGKCCNQAFEKDDSGQQSDISNQHIEQIAANIAELDRIIMADYEAKSV